MAPLQSLVLVCAIKDPVNAMHRLARVRSVFIKAKVGGHLGMSGLEDSLQSSVVGGET